MGAGASKYKNEDNPSNMPHALQKGQNSSSAKQHDIFVEADESPLGMSPFDNQPSGVSYDLGGPGEKVLSDNKLKKLALGQQGYMDQQRDYDSTLSNVHFNKTNAVEWGHTADAKSATGPPAARPSQHPQTATTTTGSKQTQQIQRPQFATQDLSRMGSAGRGGAGRGPPPYFPGGGGPSGKPPPPKAARGPSGPIAGGVVQHPEQNVVIAPSILPLPKAAMETAPEAYRAINAVPQASHGDGTSRQQQTEWRPDAANSGTTIQTDTSTNRTSIATLTASQAGNAAAEAKYSGGNDSDDDSDLSNEDNSELYDFLETGTDPQPPTMRESTQRRFSDEKGQSITSSSVSSTVGTITVATTYSVASSLSGGTATSIVSGNSHLGTVGPAGPGVARGGPLKAHTRPPSINTTRDSSRYLTNAVNHEDEDMMYATFADPNVPILTPSSRPQQIPALSISPVMTPKPAGLPPGASKLQLQQPQNPPKPSGRPPNVGNPFSGPPHNPSSNGGVMATGGSYSQLVTNGSQQLTRGPSPQMNARRPGPSTAPRPAGSSPHAVKETKDVKRNFAQLPAHLSHMNPTKGDWLNKRHIVNNYILLDVLGTGSYGEVRLCKDRTTDQLFAIKILSRDLLTKKKSGNTSETYFEDIKREIAIMKKLLHPNVLRLFEVLDDPKVKKMYLVLEYQKKGDLINFLKEKDKEREKTDPHYQALNAKLQSSDLCSPMDDQDLWNIFRQVTAGVRYLHYQNVVHGDIKPQNLLVGENGIVKIADFGISKMLHASGQKLADAAGTPAFMSPELCTGQAFSGQMADVWALGATMFMLRFGQPPYVAKSVVNLFNKIQNDPLVFPYEIDAGLKDLLEKMLTKEPAKRLPLHQVMMHPWLKHSPNPSNSLYNSRPPQHVAPVGSSSKSELGGDLQFKPPPSYDQEEQDAMRGPVNTVGEHELFSSIGLGIREVNDHGGEDGNTDGHDSSGSHQQVDDNMLATNWGGDVFELVDDGNQGSDSYDSDEDYDDDDPKTIGAQMTAASKPARKKDVSNNNANVTMNSNGSASSLRLSMSQDEEERRAKRFQVQLNKKSFKSTATLLPGNEHKVTDSYGAPPSSNNSSKAVSPTIAASPSTVNRSRKLLSTPGSTPSHGRKMSMGGFDDDEELDSLTMEDFSRMMDTLAMQPVMAADAEEVAPIVVSMKGDFSAQEKNAHNAIAAAVHSLQGRRPHQEDRWVIIPNVGIAPETVALNLPSSAVESLNKYTLACVFDGHNGAKCSEYLTKNLPSHLIAHDKLLSVKSTGVKDALKDVCQRLDSLVCDYLRDEEDLSGSTGIIMVYDGRKGNNLHVANVGDSMCILSRSGTAVKLTKQHRLGDEGERKRVESLGGTVVNGRVNGVLAVSRAFGDISFKDQGVQKGIVVSEPDVYTEVITPMTEFAIIATDGLWDVTSPQVAVNMVRKCLSKEGDLKQAAKELCDAAITKGSVDNITALIISFNMGGKS